MLPLLLGMSRPSAAPRSVSATCFDFPPAGVSVTVASGLAILLRPESALWGLLEGEPQPSEREDALTSALCSSDGWDFRLSLDGEPAQSLHLRFDRRSKALPQGTAHARGLQSLSVQPEALWSLEMTLDDADEAELEVCVQRERQTDGTPVAPLFLCAVLAEDDRASRVAALTSGRALGNRVVRLSEGTVVCKAAAGALGGALGLSQIVTVGTFEARPAAPPPVPTNQQPPTPPTPPPTPLPPAPLSPAPPPARSSAPLSPGVAPPRVSSLMRRALVAATVGASVVGLSPGASLTKHGLSPGAALAADLSALANRGLRDSPPASLPILEAQASVKQLLSDEDTFRTMVAIGHQARIELPSLPNPCRRAPR
jgi:hypothetical protein